MVQHVMMVVSINCHLKPKLNPLHSPGLILTPPHLEPHAPIEYVRTRSRLECSITTRPTHVMSLDSESGRPMCPMWVCKVPYNFYNDWVMFRALSLMVGFLHLDTARWLFIESTLNTPLPSIHIPMINYVIYSLFIEVCMWCVCIELGDVYFIVNMNLHRLQMCSTVLWFFLIVNLCTHPSPRPMGVVLLSLRWPP